MKFSTPEETDLLRFAARAVHGLAAECQVSAAAARTLAAALVARIRENFGGDRAYVRTRSREPRNAEILALYDGGESRTALAKRFEIPVSTVDRVVGAHRLPARRPPPGAGVWPRWVEPLMSICRIRDCAEALEVMRPDLAAWLSDVARKIAAGLPAGMALEIKGPGAKRERDKLLLQAATVLRQDDTFWSLAGKLAARIAAPARRHPSEADRLIGELLALAAAAPLPRTQRQLYAVLLKHWRE